MHCPCNAEQITIIGAIAKIDVLWLDMLLKWAFDYLTVACDGLKPFTTYVGSQKLVSINYLVRQQVF